MNKQSEAKERQLYHEKPLVKCCKICKHYKSDIFDITDLLGSYTREKNRRCGIGGFAVKPTAVCKMWEMKGGE